MGVISSKYTGEMTSAGNRQIETQEVWVWSPRQCHVWHDLQKFVLGLGVEESRFLIYHTIKITLSIYGYKVKYKILVYDKNL